MVVNGFVCWELAQESRDILMAMFQPIYPDIEAHHVTIEYGVPSDYPIPLITSSEVVGEAYDRGVQALVVAINGSVARPDGKTYHLTWSIDRAAGKHPSNSNDLLRRGWWPLKTPIPIILTPAFHARDI